MFNLPWETALLMLPWPAIWVTVALVMYFKMRREERIADAEDQTTTD